MNYSPMNHFEYPRLDVECGCLICTDWRQQRDLFDEMKRLTLIHNRSCMCWRCRRRREFQNSFLAAASRRELYCEMSFHASRHPSYGPKLMNWVSRELADNTETDGWWSTLAQAYSLTFWFAKFQATVEPVSGIRPTAVVVPLSGNWWCGWCGDTLPQGMSGFCSDACSADHAVNMAANRPRQPRRRLVETVSGWAQVLSGCVSQPVSGLAA